MLNLLKWLEEWHRDNAFGDGYALDIKISTVDNPGWSVKIDLTDTKYDGISMDEIKEECSDDDWIFCKIENKIFQGYGDCLKLEKIIEAFRKAINIAEWNSKMESEHLPDIFTSIKDSFIYGNGYWYPLERKYKPELKPVVYNLDRIYKAGGKGIDLLKTVFQTAEINSVRGFHPFKYEGQATWMDIPDIKKFLYEKDGNAYKFSWINEEYYFDVNEDWIVYVSHEGTITFCGERLVLIAEEVIPREYKM